jgi:xylulokinase
MTSKPSEPLTIGLDLGTSSSKAVLVDATGAVVRAAWRAQRVSRPRPGWVEQDPVEAWWGPACELLSEVVGDDADRVDAVAVSGIGPCVLVTGGDGVPLRPAILYGIDTRATAEVAELHARYGTDAIVARCGNALSTQAGGPKLRWIAQHEPDVMERALKVFSASSFLVHGLTGEYVLDRHTASQYDPLYDLAGSAWIERWWDEIAGPIEPPRLAWPTEVVGVVSAGAAELTGLREGTPVTAGTVDAWAEAVSVGVRHPGDLMLMYGTTMFLIAVTAGHVRHPALWTTDGVDPGACSLAGGMAASGALTTWWADVVGEAHIESLYTAAAAIAPGSNGLRVLPYFAGERTPIADPAARGMIAGLSLDHDRGHIFRALLEATAFGVRHNLEAFGDAGVAIERVVAVGGGTSGGLWPQIVSDVTGRQQVVPEVTIGAAYGDARLAAEAVGTETACWNPAARTTIPDADASTVYDRAYGQYRELYEATKHVIHELAAENGYRT